MPYILEIQRFDSDGHLQHPEWKCTEQGMPQAGWDAPGHPKPE